MESTSEQRRAREELVNCKTFADFAKLYALSIGMDEECPEFYSVAEFEYMSQCKEESIDPISLRGWHQWAMFVIGVQSLIQWSKENRVEPPYDLSVGDLSWTTTAGI